MDFALQPVSEAGRNLAALAERHAVDFAASAAEHDRAATFPFANIEALHASGVLAGATMPSSAIRAAPRMPMRSGAVTRSPVRWSRSRPPR